MLADTAPADTVPADAAACSRTRGRGLHASLLSTDGTTRGPAQRPTWPGCSQRSASTAATCRRPARRSARCLRPGHRAGCGSPSARSAARSSPRLRWCRLGLPPAPQSAVPQAAAPQSQAAELPARRTRSPCARSPRPGHRRAQYRDRRPARRPRARAQTAAGPARAAHRRDRRVSRPTAPTCSPLAARRADPPADGRCCRAPRRRVLGRGSRARPQGRPKPLTLDELAEATEVFVTAAPASFRSPRWRRALAPAPGPGFPARSWPRRWPPPADPPSGPGRAGLARPSAIAAPAPPAASGRPHRPWWSWSTTTTRSPGTSPTSSRRRGAGRGGTQRRGPDRSQVIEAGTVRRGDPHPAFPCPGRGWASSHRHRDRVRPAAVPLLGIVPGHQAIGVAFGAWTS